MSAGNLPPDERLNRVGFKSLLGFCKKCKKLYPLSGSVKVCPACGQPLQEVILVSLARLDADLIGKRVAMDVVLTGESNPKAAPVKWSIKCRRCGLDEQIDFLKEELYPVFIETLASPTYGPTVSLVKRIANRRFNGCSEANGARHSWDIEVQAYRTFKLITVRPDVSSEEISFGEAFERNYPAILLDPSGLGSCQIFTAICKIQPHTRKRDLIPIIEHVVPRRTIAVRPSRDELDYARDFFKFRELDQWLEFVEPRICPHIVRRPDAKLAALLTVSSPLYFRLGDRHILTVLRTIFIGDGRTGKGSIIRWFRDKLRINAYAVGETAKRTGLGFSIDKDTRILTWGVLPQADGTLALIEALHGFASDQLSQLREALYQGQILVRMAVSGRRLCRARIIADANSRGPLSHEAFWVLAIPKVRCFKDVIDLTRWDLFLPFSSTDVDRKEIAQKQDRPEDREFIKALCILTNFAWSLKPSELVITDDAYKSLNDESAEIIERYCFPLVPIVHDGFRETLLKVSASFAIASLNLKDGSIRIEPEHIELAKTFFEHLFNRWELSNAIELYTEPGLTEADWVVLREQLKEDSAKVKILKTLALKNLDGKALAAETGYSYNYIRQPISELKEVGLIDRRGGVYVLTKKGVQAFKRLQEIYEQNGG
ncbi:MAG: hypothetical protein DRN03_02140 [Thermoplasmata archaeon]|nr:MAG: hypothetical protein DRN03_02140 [Thermoplasmata archaeon]